MKKIESYRCGLCKSLFSTKTNAAECERTCTITKCFACGFPLNDDGTGRITIFEYDYNPDVVLKFAICNDCIEKGIHDKKSINVFYEC